MKAQWLYWAPYRSVDDPLMQRGCVGYKTNLGGEFAGQIEKLAFNPDPAAYESEVKAAVERLTEQATEQGFTLGAFDEDKAFGAVKAHFNGAFPP